MIGKTILDYGILDKLDEGVIPMDRDAAVNGGILLW